MAKKIPIELQVEKEKTNRELWRELMSGGRQVAVMLVNSEAIQSIFGVMLVETLHRIKVEHKPLLSDELEIALNSVIISKAAVSSVSDLLSLVNPFD